MIYLQIAAKLIIALFALWAMTKILGKKEISQLTAFDFVSSLMFSELVGNTIYQQDLGKGGSTVRKTWCTRSGRKSRVFTCRCATIRVCHYRPPSGKDGYGIHSRMTVTDPRRNPNETTDEIADREAEAETDGRKTTIGATF